MKKKQHRGFACMDAYSQIQCAIAGGNQIVINRGSKYMAEIGRKGGLKTQQLRKQHGKRRNKNNRS